MFRAMNAPALVKFNSKRSMDFIEAVEFQIDSEIVSANLEPKHRTFAPSSFRCPRINWFRIKGVQPDKIDTPDRNLKFYAEMGTACHNMLQGYISKMDYWYPVDEYLKDHPIDYEYTVESFGYEYRFNVTAPYPIRFACDGILRLDEICLLEIKSCSTQSFCEITEPKPEHIDQVKCYCKFLGLRRVIFLYIDRVYGDMKAYDIRVSETDVEDIEKRLDEVMWSVEYDIAPEKLPKGDPWCTSNMCPYYKRCKSW